MTLTGMFNFGLLLFLSAFATGYKHENSTGNDTGNPMGVIKQFVFCMRALERSSATIACRRSKKCLDKYFTSSEEFIATSVEKPLKSMMIRELDQFDMKCYFMLAKDTRTLSCQLSAITEAMEKIPRSNVPYDCQSLYSFLQMITPFYIECSASVFPAIVYNIILGIAETLACSVDGDDAWFTGVYSGLWSPTSEDTEVHPLSNDTGKVETLNKNSSENGLEMTYLSTEVMNTHITNKDNPIAIENLSIEDPDTENGVQSNPLRPKENYHNAFKKQDLHINLKSLNSTRFNASSLNLQASNKSSFMKTSSVYFVIHIIIHYFL